MMYLLTKTTESKKMTKLIAVLGLNKNVIREAKEEDGKFYAWVPRKGKWERVAKTKIKRVAA